MDWQPYIKASWEMVMAAEGKTQTMLEQDLEAYLVQMMARNFRNKSMPPDIVCLELAKARQAQDFRNIGDGCLFVDAWRIRPARLVCFIYPVLPAAATISEMSVSSTYVWSVS